MHRHLLLLAAGLIASVAAATGDTALSQAVRRDPPSALFTSMGLTPEQIASIETGQAVAKVLSRGEASEVYVFGAVHVDAAPDTYLKRARDVGRLSGTEGYLGVGELGERATVADLASLTLDPDDVKALKKCREGSCDCSCRPHRFRRFAIRWTGRDADAGEQVNTLARQMVLQLIASYRRGGNAALGEYRDKEHPARIAAQFATMVGRASALPDVMPELRRYLLDTRPRSSRTPTASSTGKRSTSG